jgi:two-component sensor histidine kinase
MRNFLSLLLIVLCYSIRVAAQDACNCSVFSDDGRKKFEKAAQTGNYNEASAIINGYKVNADACCKAVGFTMEAMLKNFLVKGAEAKVAAIEALSLLNRRFNAYASLECYNVLGQVYLGEQNIDSSTYYYLEGLKLATTSNNYLMQAKFNNNLGRAFLAQKQYDKGLEYQKKSVEAALQTKDYAAYAQAYANLTSAYGMLHEKTNDIRYLDSSEFANGKALQYARMTGNAGMILRCYHTIGQVSIGRKDYTTALLYNDSALAMVNEHTSPQLQLNIYRVRGSIYYEMKQYPQAVAAFENARKYMTILKDPVIEKEMAGVMYPAYKANGNLPEAFTLLELYKKLSDSTFNKENSTIITEMEQKYKKVENEKKISALAQQKRIYLLLAIAGLFGIAAIGFFLRQQKLKHKKNILETEQRLNRARMNPHFFFNALTSLQKFALKENDPQAMASNLSKFSNIMRETLESTYKEYVTIEQEMEFLNEYLEVQKIRFPHAFSYEVSADKDLDIDQLQIPAMIIQPFVENSIEHGFVGVEYAGNIIIKFASESKELRIEIKDNGKGLNTTIKENNEHISRASQIIKDRIYLLNIKLKTKAGFRIDNADGGGVLVKIHLPLLYKESKNS